MGEAERIKLLEAALIKYIEMYGFTDEARDYYIRVPQFKSSETRRHVTGAHRFLSVNSGQTAYHTSPPFSNCCQPVPLSVIDMKKSAHLEARIEWTKCRLLHLPTLREA